MRNAWQASVRTESEAAVATSVKKGTSFELRDGATARSSQLPLRTGTIGPAALDIASLHKDLDVFTYDPGFGQTAATQSRITYINGDPCGLPYMSVPAKQLG